MCFKDRGKDHRPRNVSSLQKLKEARLFLQNLRIEHSHADTMIFTRRDPLWSSDPQNCKIITLYCFKPLIVRQFVTAVLGTQYRSQVTNHPHSPKKWFLKRTKLTKQKNTSQRIRLVNLMLQNFHISKIKDKRQTEENTCDKYDRERKEVILALKKSSSKLGRKIS